MGNYIDFLEEHLGEIDYGWSTDADNTEMPFQIVKYKKGPFNGSVTFSTLGLSDVELACHETNRKFRQELILVSYANLGDINIPGILQQVGLMALEHNVAFLRGDVIGPYGKVFENTELEGFYVAPPVYFPESFEVYNEGEQQQIIQVWLVPITYKEATYIRKNGWEKFEELLEEFDPNLVDFNRKSIID